MFVRFFGMLLAMLLAVPVFGGAAHAQAIGQISSATGAGLVQTAAGRAALKPGLRLSVGDVVTTNAPI